MVVQLWGRDVVSFACAFNLHKSSIWRWENRWLAAASSTPPDLFAFIDIGVESCMELLRQVHTVDLTYLILAAVDVGRHL